jgi:hypothetical protein
MPHLKAYHYELLRKILAARAVPLADVDGRLLRPLSAAGFVQVEGEQVRVTREGRAAVVDLAPVLPTEPPPGKLSAAQEDLLRRILRAPGIASDEVDQRTARALRARGLIREVDGQLSAIPDAVASLQSHHSTSTRPKRGRRPRRHPRAEAILKAVEQLEQALPPEAEVLVGSIMCAADDVTAGFRKHARMLDQRQNGRESQR